MQILLYLRSIRGITNPHYAEMVSFYDGILDDSVSITNDAQAQYYNAAIDTFFDICKRDSCQLLIAIRQRQSGSRVYTSYTLHSIERIEPDVQNVACKPSVSNIQEPPQEPPLKKQKLSTTQ